MFSKIVTFFNNYFWVIAGINSAVAIVFHYFVKALTPEEHLMHSVILFIAILAIDIKRWLKEKS